MNIDFSNLTKSNKKTATTGIVSILPLIVAQMESNEVLHAMDNGAEDFPFICDEDALLGDNPGDGIMLQVRTGNAVERGTASHFRAIADALDGYEGSTATEDCTPAEAVRSTLRVAEVGEDKVRCVVFQTSLKSHSRSTALPFDSFEDILELLTNFDPDAPVAASDTVQGVVANTLETKDGATTFKTSLAKSTRSVRYPASEHTKTAETFGKLATYADEIAVYVREERAKRKAVLAEQVAAAEAQDAELRAKRAGYRSAGKPE